MLYGKTDVTVLGYLGRALSLELTAMQQYMTLSRLLRLRGFEELAQTLQTEAVTEMEHAERIVGRMLVAGAAPAATQLRAPRLADSLPELMAGVQSLEREIAEFYAKAVEHCTRIGDFDNRLFFEQLLAEEIRHGETLAGWRDTHLGHGGPLNQRGDGQ